MKRASIVVLAFVAAISILGCRSTNAVEYPVILTVTPPSAGHNSYYIRIDEDGYIRSYKGLAAGAGEDSTGAVLPPDRFFDSVEGSEESELDTATFDSLQRELSKLLPPSRKQNDIGMTDAWELKLYINGNTLFEYSWSQEGSDIYRVMEKIMSLSPIPVDMDGFA